MDWLNDLFDKSTNAFKAWADYDIRSSLGQQVQTVSPAYSASDAVDKGGVSFGLTQDQITLIVLGLAAVYVLKKVL